jgi:signal peptide peptidase SppA
MIKKRGVVSAEESTRRVSRISARLFNTPLLISANAAMAIASNLAQRFGVVPMQPPAAVVWDADDGSLAESEPYSVSAGVATIAIHGELVNRSSYLDAPSGLVSYDWLQNALLMAEKDPQVRSILLDIDSPGGEAAGAMETAIVVRSVSRTKPVKAFVNSLAASAAYAIASGASEIVVTPSAIVGSIGVIVLHMDFSKSLAEAGVKPTLLTEGDFKGDGNQFEPLEPAAKARIQTMIRSYYDLFVDCVGAHRSGLGAAGARKTEAGVYVGQAGVDAGLADRVGSLGDVFASASNRFSKPPAAFTKPGAQALAISDGIGAARERERIRAILGCGEAKDRRHFAEYLALTTFATELSIEEVVAILATAPSEAAQRPSRMSLAPRPAISPLGPRVPTEAEQTDAMWRDNADKLNAESPGRRK